MISLQGSRQRLSSKRASRFVRPVTPSSLILQPRDRDILLAVYSHRFLSSEQIMDMFFGCVTRSNIRLRKLWENNFLDRHFVYPLAFHGSSQAIYSLGERGVDILAESLGVDRAEIKVNRDKDNCLSNFFVEHILAVNDFRICFQNAVNNNPQLRLERWISEREAQDGYEVQKDNVTIKHRIRPDGYGRYWYQGKLYSFFLELDCSTETNGKFQSKVRSYLDYKESGRYHQIYGVKFFRVLVVTTTAKRLENLKQATESITDDIFWFTILDEIRKGMIFGPIWRRVGQNQLLSLLG